VFANLFNAVREGLSLLTWGGWVPPSESGR
jgi:hypothetical protein